MWKFLIFNSLWFFGLFAGRFSGERWRRALLWAALLAGGVFTALKSYVDPIAWFYYVIFSVTVYTVAGFFKQWAFAWSDVLKEEERITTQKLEAEKKILRTHQKEADTLSHRANEISYLYDRMTEMSESLDHLTTFLVLGEVLHREVRFEAVKLACFNVTEGEYKTPDEYYRLTPGHFKNLFDRTQLLRDKKELLSDTTPFDSAVLKAVFEEGRELHRLAGGAAEIAGLELPAGSPDFLAYPLFIEQKIFAVLILIGPRKEELPVVSIIIGRFIAELQRVKLFETVENLAITDGLTRVFARRHLLERLEGEVQRSKQFQLKLSFLMVDIDHFKKFNDDYGHLVGDAVLREVAGAIKNSIRELDLVGRYGGEEFGVLLIESDASDALVVAERIRQAIEKQTVTAYDEKLKVTVSVGCSTLSAELTDAGSLIDASDSALYEAKRQGRNRVCAAKKPGYPAL